MTKTTEEWFDELAPGFLERAGVHGRARLDLLAGLFNLAQRRTGDYEVIEPSCDTFPVYGDTRYTNRQHKIAFPRDGRLSKNMPVLRVGVSIYDYSQLNPDSPYRQQAMEYTSPRYYFPETRMFRLDGNDEVFFETFITPGTCYVGESLTMTLVRDGPEQAFSRALAVVNNYTGRFAYVPAS